MRPQWLRQIGPGILVAATGVGAGDLVTAALAGAHFGVSIGWALLVGAAMKWLLNEGLARWQMATGTTLLEGWAAQLRVHWLFLPYLLIWSFAVAGTLMSACGVAALALLPIGQDPVLSKRIWGAVHSLAGLVLVWIGGFRVFERMMAACIGLMFVSAVACAALMIPQIEMSRLHSVSPLALRGEELRWTLGLIGGVGGTVTLLCYGYWIREQGRTGEAGVRTCRIDLAVGYFVTAFFGLAMVVIAAGTPGLKGQGASLLVVLSDRLADELGVPVKYAFLLGAWGAVFSSLLGVWQGVPYLFADFLHALGWTRASPRGADSRPGVHDPAYRAFLLFLALPPMILLWQQFEVVQLTYAILGALFLPLLAATLLILNNRARCVPPALRNRAGTNLALILTLAFFSWQGWQALLDIAQTRAAPAAAG